MEAVVCRRADVTVGRTGLALLPFGVVEALRTGVPTLTLEEVPEHPKLICTRNEKEILGERKWPCGDTQAGFKLTHSVFFSSFS